MNHICLSFQYAHTYNTSRRAGALRPVRLQCRDRGVGPYKALTPMEKFVIWLRRLQWGPCG